MYLRGEMSVALWSLDTVILTEKTTLVLIVKAWYWFSVNLDVLFALHVFSGILQIHKIISNWNLKLLGFNSARSIPLYM